MKLFEGRIEPIIVLLFIAMVFFTLCLFAAEKSYKDDGQMFQAIFGCLSGVTGAFLARIKVGGMSESSTLTKVEKPPTVVTVEEKREL